MIFKRLCQAAVIAVSIPLAIGSLSAQSNATDGAIDGYAADQTSAAIANTQVTVKNLDTNVSQTVKSDATGYFDFPLLPVGQYMLSATAPGFGTYVQNGITVGVGMQVHINPRLTLSGSQATVQVNADASILDTSTPAIGGTLNQVAVENLPIVTRNIYNFFFMSPGIAGPPSSSFGTPTISFGGIVRNQWNVDGLDDSSRQFSSNIRLVINTPEVVKQSEVLSNGYSAEFGRAAGGQVDIVTRGGSNDFHGQFLYLYRPSDLAAYQGPVAAGATPPANDVLFHDYDVNLGGPISHNRLFFFANYEHNPYYTPTPITITSANAVTLGLAPSDIGSANTDQTFDTPSVRIDYKLNDKNSGFARYMFFHNNEPNIDAGGLSSNDRGLDYHDVQNGGELQLATILSPKLLNELRFGVVQRAQKYFLQQTPAAPAVLINISGVADFGNSASALSQNFEQSIDLVDNLMMTHGKHSLKYGVDVETTKYEVVTATPTTYTFQNLTQYLNTLAGTGTYYQMTTFLGNPDLDQRYYFYNGFAQDEFRVTPRLVLDFGLRYQYIQVPVLDASAPYIYDRSVHTDKDDIAPRFSFSYQPLSDSKLAIRGAYGMYYDTPALSLFQTAAQTNGERLRSYTIPGSQADAPIFPEAPTSINPADSVPNIIAFDPNFRIMYAHQANLQVEREITNNLSLNVRYTMMLTRFGPYEHDVNLGSPSGYLADGRPIYGNPRPNAEFQEIDMVSSGSNTNYHGLGVTVTKRLSHGLQFTSSYTWSKALGDGDQLAAAIEDPSDLARDYGRLSADLRHYWVFQGLYSPHFDTEAARWINGTTVSIMSWVHSGYPLNPYAGSDLNKDLDTNDRPLFAARNSVLGPHFYQQDLRFERDIHIKDRYHVEGIAEAENFMNHLNANCNATSGCSSAIQNNVTTSTYNQMISAATSRQIQFGARFYF